MSDRDWRAGNPAWEDIEEEPWEDIEEERRKHNWFRAVVRNHESVLTPVMLCRRRGCQIKWWPHRNEPKSECKGRGE